MVTALSRPSIPGAARVHRGEVSGMAPPVSETRKLSDAMPSLNIMRSWGSAPPPSVIIDLSPIVLLKDEPSWGWVEAAVKAWREQRDPEARFYGVADNSL